MISASIDSPAYLSPRLQYSRDHEIRRGIEEEKDASRGAWLQNIRRRLKLTGDREAQYRQENTNQDKEDSTRDSLWHADGVKARTNVTGAAFNIINMTYYNTPEGDRLKRHDHLVKYRNEVRAYNLALKSSVGIDPIAGCKTLEISFPIMSSN